MPYVGRTPSAVPVTADDIPANSIDASKIIDGSIELAEIADNSITDAKLNSSKLNGIEAGANVTDTANVTSSGALMASEVTNLAAVKAFAATDYATAAQGTTADNALPLAGGTMTGAITTNSTFDGRDVSADGAKLDGIETGATADQTKADIEGLGIAASSITGALPAISGSALTGVTPTKSTIEALGIAASSITGALPAIDGSALTGNVGKVLQVVRGEASSAVQGTGDFDVFSATITPTQTNSNILISVYTQYSTMSQGQEWGLVLKRGATKILGESGRNYFISGGGVDAGNWVGTQNSLAYSVNYASKTDLDTTRTAGTTSITYTIRKEQGNGTCDVRFVHDGWGGNGPESNRSKAVMVLTEVAQ